MEGESEPVSHTREIPPLCVEDLIPVGPDDPIISTLPEVLPSGANLTGSRSFSDESMVVDEDAEDDSVKILTIDDLSKIKTNILGWMKDIDHELLKFDIDPTLLDSFMMDVIKAITEALIAAEEGRSFKPTEEETSEDLVQAYMVKWVESEIKTRFGL